MKTKIAPAIHDTHLSCENMNTILYAGNNSRDLIN